jgi:hypothetical protein
MNAGKFESQFLPECIADQKRFANPPASVYGNEFGFTRPEQLLQDGFSSSRPMMFSISGCYLLPNVTKKGRFGGIWALYISPNIEKKERFGEIWYFIFRQMWQKKGRFGRI